MFREIRRLVGGMSLGNAMPQDGMEAYRSFRIRENFPRLLLFLL